MSTNKGMMILNKSEDLKCNYKNLVKTLNRYRWNQDDIKWIAEPINKDEIGLFIECGRWDELEYPTVYAQRLSGYLLIDDDGNKKFVTHLNRHEEDEISEHVYAHVSLEDMTKDIAKEIKSGYIIISSIIRDGHCYIGMQKLKINSDGSSEREESCLGLEIDYSTFEKYDSN